MDDRRGEGHVRMIKILTDNLTWACRSIFKMIFDLSNKARIIFYNYMEIAL